MLPIFKIQSNISPTSVQNPLNMKTGETTNALEYLKVSRNRKNDKNVGEMCVDMPEKAVKKAQEMVISQSSRCSGQCWVSG